MRLHLTRSLALLAIGVGIAALLGIPRGTADDVNHNDEIRSRLAKWKQHPDAERLFKGVRFDTTIVAPPSTLTPGPQVPSPGTGRAVALCVGVNTYNNDANHYAGKATTLQGCVNDAQAMAAILTANKFSVTSLHNEQATAAAVTKFIKDQHNLKSGDILVITFAGHGSQVADKNGDETIDRKDETLCCYDRMIIDDELFELWKGFEPGVRIAFFADSCHSGTIQRLMEQAERVLQEPPQPIAERTTSAQRQVQIERARDIQSQPRSRDADAPQAPETGILLRNIPFSEVEAAGLFDKPIYDEFKSRGFRGEEGRGAEIRASLLTFAACQDDETAGEISGHGVFTASLLDVVKLNPATYVDLANQVQAKVKRQRTKFNEEGPATTFKNQKPFAK